MMTAKTQPALIRPRLATIVVGSGRACHSAAGRDAARVCRAMDRTGRLLVYSHDSFGLGHLRRCQTIAHHLVDAFPDLTALILSGSPIIGSFDFKSRVDFVRVPGVIKLRNGEYTPLQLHLGLDQTLAMRGSIIRRVRSMCSRPTSPPAPTAPTIRARRAARRNV